jgi:AbrB family looped-hinge helix DNA binding protein
MALSFTIMAVTVTIDAVGRLVVPQEVRRRLDLAPGTRLQLREEQGRLVLEPERSEPAVRETGGLLILEQPLDGQPPDHRDVRAERIRRLGGR